MRIFLAGFMGTGKSSVGRLLAQRLGLRFIDMDEEIEGEEGLSIPQIFQDKGESYFRQKEKEWVKRLVKENDIVVALGGGTVVDEENLRLLKETGTLILLKASPQIIYERTKNYTHRPLLNVENPLSRIEELLARREEFYNRIPLQIDTASFSQEQVAQAILELLKPKDENKRSSHLP